MGLYNFLNENENTWNIPTKIKKNIKIGDINKYPEGWKAKIILGNNMGENQKIGQWDDVGYIMIDLNSNNIIPIARADEHQTGYELIDYYIRKKLIPDGKYINLFPLSITYIYGNYENDYKEKLNACKKWLGYGGKSGEIKIAYRKNNLPDLIGNMEDLINGRLEKDTPSGKLASLGKHFIDLLEEVAKLNSMRLSGDQMKLKRVEKHFFNKVRQLMPVIRRVYGNVGLLKNWDYNRIDNLTNNLNNLEARKDYQTIESELFGHNGFKNDLHIALKNNMKKDDWDYNKLKSIFGDLKLALQEFNRLGSI